MSYKENLAFIKKDMCMTNNLDIIKSLIDDALKYNQDEIYEYLLYEINNTK